MLYTHNFTHVQDDDSTFETNTKTSNQTTSNNDTQGVATDASDHLDDHTDHVDEAAHDDSPFATDALGDITSDDGTEEGTSREDGDDERLVGGAQGCGAGAFDQLDEVLGTVDTIDVTGVITKEDTSERGKGTDEVGLEGDRCLNAVDIVGPVDVCSASHCE